MRLFLLCLLFYASSTHALELTLGIGVCQLHVDYCPRPVGKVALSQVLWHEDKHQIIFNVEHFSKLGNGELRWEGDRGTEFYLLEYKVKLR